mmetsp:Transcript_7473/g.11076  ORF Transcript_7473/g.11076 Transcript_7473/m.11076 type:complete len:352 (+) Transcript_7473:1779-2834(+)
MQVNENDIKYEVVRLYFEDKLFRSYNKLEEILHHYPNISNDYNQETIWQIEAELRKREITDIVNDEKMFKDLILIIKNEYKESKMIISELNSSEGWEVKYDKNNINVFSSNAISSSLLSSNGDLNLQSIKILGKVNAPLTNCLAIFYEIDLYKEWVPRMDCSRIVHQPSNYRYYCYYSWNMPLTISNRNCLTYGYGVDELDKEGSIYVFIKSYTLDNLLKMRLKNQTTVKKDILQENKDIIKEENDNFHLATPNHIELDCHFAGFKIKALSQTSCEISIISNVDPKLSFIPYWIQNLAYGYAGPYVIEKIRSIASTIPERIDFQKRMNITRKDIYDDLKKRVSQYFENNPE